MPIEKRYLSPEAHSAVTAAQAAFVATRNADTRALLVNETSKALESINVDPCSMTDIIEAGEYLAAYADINIDTDEDIESMTDRDGCEPEAIEEEDENGLEAETI